MGIFDKKFNKAKALAGATFLAAAPALSQEAPINPSHTIENSISTENPDSLSKNAEPFKSMSLAEVHIPNFNLDSIYNENKESNDANFNCAANFRDDSAYRDIWISYTGNILSFVKIISSKDDGSTVKEKFFSFEELAQKYPDYVQKAKNLYANSYAEYVKNIAWNKILTEREKTLSHDTKSFIVSPELFKLIEQQAKIKNSGGITDGYDQFHYYLIGENTPEQRYKFYEKFNLKVEDVADHLTDDYYSPLLKNRPLEEK